MPRYKPTSFSGWKPPSYEVLADGKVSDTTPGTPNNWGRWGPDDQAGTVNLVTSEQILAGAQLVRTGQRFALGLPIGIEIPETGFPLDEVGSRLPTRRQRMHHYFGGVSADGVVGDAPDFGSGDAQRAVTFNAADDFLIMSTSQGTQLDGFLLGVDGSLYNGYWAGLVTARSGARRLGVEHRSSGIIGRGVLLDIARHLGVDRLEDEFRIGPDLLLKTAAAQGVELGMGDILLLRTGWLGWWYDQDLEGREATDVRANPGISAHTIPLLAEHDVILVGLDNIGTEVFSSIEPGQRLFEFHLRAIRDLGMSLVELLDLDELAEVCAQERRYEFFFVGMPVPVVGASASPLNPVAIM